MLDMTITKTFVPLIKGVDLSMHKLPLVKIDSGKTGPTVWITAAIHGDEVTGISTIHSLINKLAAYPLITGIIYTIPILNPSGFEMISRREPFDETDLNRQFPGDPHGSTAERQAHIILTTILKTNPDYVIDLHTDSVNSIGYCIVDKTEKSPEVLKKTIILAETLGFPWAFDLPGADYDPSKTITGALINHDVPAITIELGGPMVVDEYFRKKGLDAIWKFLQALKMVPAKHNVELIASMPKEVYIFEERLQCDSTGIIDYRVRPGEKFSKGQILGKIRNVYGKEIEIIRAPENGVLFSHEDQSIAFPGQTVFTFVKSVNLNDYLKLVG